MTNSEWQDLFRLMSIMVRNRADSVLVFRAEMEAKANELGYTQTLMEWRNMFA